MARQRSGAFSDLLTLASKLPWKVSLGLGVASFIALHVIAAIFEQTTSPSTMANFGAVVIRQYIHTFAMILQYVIPAGFLIGATVSWIKRSRSITLLDDVRSANGRDIASISWREFEALIGEGFRQRGFQVTERGGSGADGGVDLVLKRNSEKLLVQCKQWRAQQVGVGVVRELYGVMAAEHATGGYVVSSGRFTRDALEFAQGRNIELIDGSQLNDLLRKSPSQAQPRAPIPAKSSSVSDDAPACPTCQGAMIERVAKRGPNAGNSFWGCKAYPKCRGTMAKAH